MYKFKRININTLVVFDFDDTLFTTGSRVIDLKTGKKLTTRQFTALGNVTDFNRYDFSQASLIEPIKPIKNNIKKYINAIDSYGIGNVVIITARRHKNSIEKCLRKFNLPVVKIFPAKLIHDSADQKRNILLKLINQNNYEKVVIYDDSESNLIAMKSLTYNLDVEIETILV